jgi:6-phosphogluconolactonase
MLKTVTGILSLSLALGSGGSRANADDAPATGAVARARTARWALTTNQTSSTASVYAIASDSGALTLHSTIATDATPNWIAAHPSGRFAYVAAFGARTVQAFRFNRATGTLTPGASVPVPGTGSNPYAVAVEPLGRFLYVTSLGSSTIAGFWIHPLTGALSPLPGFPITTGSAPHEIVFDRFGRHAFVSNWNAGTVSAYRVGLTGRLTPVAGSPFATLPRPEGLAIHPSGRFLYATHGDRGVVSAFTVSAQGVLAPLAGSPFPAGLDPFGVAASLDGRTLYVSDPAIEAVLMRRVDVSSGALSDLPPSRVRAGNNVRAIRVDPSGRLLYVASAFPGALFSYAIDANGVLTPVAGSPLAAEDGLSSLALVR